MNSPYSDEDYPYQSGRSNIGRVYWDETLDDPDKDVLLNQMINREAIHGEYSYDEG